MTETDLRAAATDWRERRKSDLSRQRDMLADAMADELDETLIGAAWLCSVGGIQDEHPRKITFTRNDGLAIGLWHVDDGWKAMLIQTENCQSCIVRGLTTRGEVRRLCAALGIELRTE